MSSSLAPARDALLTHQGCFNPSEPSWASPLIPEELSPIGLLLYMIVYRSQMSLCVAGLKFLKGRLCRPSSEWKWLDLLTWLPHQPPVGREERVSPLGLPAELQGQMAPARGVGREAGAEGQFHTKRFHALLYSSSQHPPLSKDKETMTQRGGNWLRYALLGSCRAGT